MSTARQGDKHPLFGTSPSGEIKAKISNGMKANINGRGGKGRKRAEGAGSPSVQIEVLDMETGIKTNLSFNE